MTTSHQTGGRGGCGEHFLSSRWGPGPGMDREAAVLGGAGGHTHVWAGGDEHFIPGPGRRKNVHHQTGRWTGSKCPPGARLSQRRVTQGGLGVLLHRQRAWRAGFLLQVTLSANTYAGFPSPHTLPLTHNFGDRPMDFRDHTDRLHCVTVEESLICRMN